MKEEPSRYVPPQEQPSQAEEIARNETAWKAALLPPQAGRLEAFYHVQQRIAETEEQLVTGDIQQYVWKVNGEATEVIFVMDEAYLETMRKLRDEKRAELAADPRTKEYVDSMHQIPVPSQEQQPRFVPPEEQTGHAEEIAGYEASWKASLPPPQAGRLDAFYHVQQRIQEAEEQLEDGDKQHLIWKEDGKVTEVIFEMGEDYLEKMRKIREEKRAELAADPRTKVQAETIYQVFADQRQEKERRIDERAKRMLQWLEDDESSGSST